MNRALERFALLAGLLVLVGSLQFGASLLGAAAALVAAIALGIAATLLWLQFELSEGNLWLPPLTLGLSSLVAVLIIALTFPHSYLVWISPLLALAGSLATVLVQHRSRARCNLCNRRLRSQAVVFRCPRCTQEVCDEGCWSYEHRRCQLCLEQRVPVLPAAESWWNRVTGPRARHGRCQICLGSPDQVDLRACPNCRRTQCRDCWDFNNGDCARCASALPELPPSLTMAVAKLVEPGNVS